MDLKIGTKIFSPSSISQSPILPKPGRRPIQFEIITKRKIVATNGKNFLALLSSPTTPLKKSNKPPTTTSTKFGNPPGTNAYFFLFKTNPINTRTINVIIAVMRVFLNSKLPIGNIVSEANVGGINSAILINLYYLCVI
ncbi:MAG: hypothetical protein WCT46_03640 [Candidatus Gracilibacteria bacterium]